MTVFYLKLIAIVTMLIDHIGLFFFPDIPLFRIIGRLSFPLFAFLIANGAYYTKNQNRYLLRLGIFALVSQIPYGLLYGLILPSFSGINIFGTLFLGLLAIVLSRNQKNHFLKGLSIALPAFVALVLDASYGAAGVVSIVIFYYYFRNLKMLILLQGFLFLCVYSLPALYEALVSGWYVNVVAFLQPLGLLSLVFIALYNHKKGPSFSLGFYVFYPVHLFILYVFKIWYS